MRMHSSHHIILYMSSKYAFVISYFMLMHIGLSEEITLLEFNEEEEEDKLGRRLRPQLQEKRNKLSRTSLSARITDQPLSSKASLGAF